MELEISFETTKQTRVKNSWKGKDGQQLRDRKRFRRNTATAAAAVFDENTLLLLYNIILSHYGRNFIRNYRSHHEVTTSDQRTKQQRWSIKVSKQYKQQLTDKRQQEQTNTIDIA